MWLSRKSSKMMKPPFLQVGRAALPSPPRSSSRSPAPTCRRSGTSPAPDRRASRMLPWSTNVLTNVSSPRIFRKLKSARGKSCAQGGSRRKKRPRGQTRAADRSGCARTRSGRRSRRRGCSRSPAPAVVRRDRTTRLVPREATAEAATSQRQDAARHYAQADDTPIPPFRAQQPDQQHQHDRHVPQIVLLDRGDAAAGVAQIVGERRGVARFVETAAGFFRNAPQRAGMHRRVEVLGVARRGAEVRDGAADALAAARGVDLRFVPAGRLGRDRRGILAGVFAVPRHRHVDDGAVGSRHGRPSPRRR